MVSRVNPVFKGHLAPEVFLVLQVPLENRAKWDPPASVVSKVKPDLAVEWDPLVTWALVVFLVLMVRRVHLVLRDPKEPKVSRALKVNQVPKDLRDHLEIKDPLVLRGLLVNEDHVVMLVLLVLRVSSALEVYLDLAVHLALKVQLVPPVYLVMLAQSVPLVKRAILVILDHLVLVVKLVSE